MQKMTMSYALVLTMTGIVSACYWTGEKLMYTKGVEYMSTEVELIGDGPVRISTCVRNVQSSHYATEFAACVTARYAFLLGFGFARLVTDSVNRADDIRTATSVYSSTARLLAGVRKLNAEVVAVNCAENGITMV